MKLQGVTEDQIKLIALLFSLNDAASDWLFYLPPGSIASWTVLMRTFIDKYFPASRAVVIRREICGITELA
jgi:hypothetical protein